MADTITIPREEYEFMKRGLEVLKDSHIYQRLLEFESNITKGKKFAREDLGF